MTSRGRVWSAGAGGGGSNRAGQLQTDKKKMSNGWTHLYANSLAINQNQTLFSVSQSKLTECSRQVRVGALAGSKRWRKRRGRVWQYGLVAAGRSVIAADLSRSRHTSWQCWQCWIAVARQMNEALNTCVLREGSRVATWNTQKKKTCQDSQKQTVVYGQSWSCCAIVKIWRHAWKDTFFDKLWKKSKRMWRVLTNYGNVKWQRPYPRVKSHNVCENDIGHTHMFCHNVCEMTNNGNSRKQKKVTTYVTWQKTTAMWNDKKKVTTYVKMTKNYGNVKWQRSYPHVLSQRMWHDKKLRQCPFLTSYEKKKTISHPC